VFFKISRGENTELLEKIKLIANLPYNDLLLQEITVIKR